MARQTRTRASIGSLLVGCAFILAPSFASAQGRPTIGPDFTLPAGEPAVPGEFIVRFREAPPEAALASSVPGAGSPVAISSDTFVFKVEAVEGDLEGALSERTANMIESLAARDDVLYVERNYYAYPLDTSPNDAEFPKMWHYHSRGTSGGDRGGVDLPRAWDASTGSRSVVVAVIDTGILPNHPEFAGSTNLLDGYDMISHPVVENDPDPGRDDDETDPGDAVSANECGPGSPARGSSWHGSHVAGTVGAGKTNDGSGIAGVAWEVGVLPVRVLGKCGGMLSDIAAAIRWSAGLQVPGVRQNQHPAQVINMSLGGRGSCSSTYRDAIADAIAQGTTVVVAAGNENDDASGYRPASCADAITVGAVDARGHIARYSNFGASVDVMAPGGDVRRSDFNGVDPDGVLSAVDGGYAYYNGTSMAAPHVAGIVALWLALDASLTPAQIASRVATNARPLGAGDGCGGNLCGSGLISAVVGDDGTPAPDPTPDPPDPDPNPPDNGSWCGLLGGELLLVPLALRWWLRRGRMHS